MYVYFPSCNFSKLCPDANERIRSFLSKQGIEICGCCRTSHRNLASDDTAITICQACRSIIGLNAPQARELSIWQFLDAQEDFPWPDYHGERITVQDCWRARDQRPLQDAVRSMMKKMNIEIAELEHSYERSDFCGRFTCEGEDHIVETDGVKGYMLPTYPQSELDRRMHEYCKIYDTQRIACYCNACLIGVRQGGAKGIHLMELIMQG